jgi:hypothetical protein
MKPALYLFALGALLFSCKPSSPEQELVQAKELPEVIQAVMDSHGGLEPWGQMSSMSFALVKEPGNEVHQIDLKGRKERIEGSNFLTGFDGDHIWLKADTTYKGNAVFYHNLMFYFVAMPFVLADDGIIYSDVEPLYFENKSFPGVKISYESEVGISPEDEYFLHFDSDTHRMEWLGYTVTYFSGEKSKEIHWIRYDDWVETNGLLLPNSLSWYKYDNNLPTEFRNKVQIADMKIEGHPFPSDVFTVVEGAEILEQ